MQRFDPTTPAGRPRLTVDFSRLLLEGVTIDSAEVTIEVHALSAGADADPGSRLDGAPEIGSGATTIAQRFRDGIENVDYVLTFIATFTDGQVEPVEAELSVRRYI